MAYTSIIPVRCLDRAVDYVRDKTKTTRGPKSLQDAVDYAINREKTELDCFETGLSCVCETAFEDMRDTVQRWQQTAGVQGYHLVNGIPFVPQKLRNFPAILEHRKIQTNPL